MDEEARLRLEHDQAAQLLRGLGETRFRLLALVPTLSGAVVALVSTGRTAVELLAIGLLGLTATLGLLAYELDNGRVRRRVAERVREAERTLLPGGPLTAVGPQALGPALVYAAALGGWVYLVAWGALRAVGVEGHARPAGLAIGGVLAVVAAGGIVRLEGGAAAR